MPAPRPAVNPAAAAAFLNTLDPGAEFLFCYKKAGGKMIELRGTFDGCLDSLIHHNDNHHDIYVTINETRAHTRKASDVAALRAVFIDIDGGGMPSNWHIMPDMICTRDDKYIHAYWLLHKNEPLDAFTPCMKALVAHYGSDNIHDLPRIMRLPGFTHWKNPDRPAQYDCNVLGYGERSSINEVMQGLNQRIEPHANGSTPHNPPRIQQILDSQDVMLAAKAYLNKVPIPHEGSRNNTLNRTAFAFCRAFGDRLSINECNGMVRNWIAGAYPPLEPDEIENTLRSAASGVQRNGIIGVNGRTQKQYIAQTPQELPAPTPAPAQPRAKPETLPDWAFDVPGVIGDIYRYSMAVAVYPDRMMNFAAALACMSFLCGRKIKSDTNLHANMYIIGLAQTGSGKEQGRKTNQAIAAACGFAHAVVDNFSSGEAIEDAIIACPSLLFQRDEVHHLVSGMTNKHDKQSSGICDKMLSLFGQSGGYLSARRKAVARDEKQVIPPGIERPNFVLYGTAIPNVFYNSLSIEFLNNGMFGRILTFDSENLRNYNPAALGYGKEIPPYISDPCKWWAREEWHKDWNGACPRTVECSPTAQVLLEDFRITTEKHWDAASAARPSDDVGCAVWSRAYELVVKLAMLYTASEDQNHLIMSENAVLWACKIIEIQCAKKLKMAHEYVADNDDEKKCKHFERLLLESGTLPRGVCMSRMNMQKKPFDDLVQTLIERGTIIQVESKHSGGGRPGIAYQRA